MILGALVCPHPPLLLTEVAAGPDPYLDSLRAQCVRALRAELDRGPERVVVIGPGPATARWDPATAGCARDFGVPGDDAADRLPLSLTVGSRLLDLARWSGSRELRAVAADADPPACAELGASLVDGVPTVLLVMGDGAAVGKDAPPGAHDPGAEPFDDAVVAALVAGDSAALLAIDPKEADRLLAAGRPAWQVLAGAQRDAGGNGWSAVLHHRSAPLGVGYFLVSWSPDTESGQTT